MDVFILRRNESIEERTVKLTNICDFPTGVMIQNAVIKYRNRIPHLNVKGAQHC